MIGLAGGQIASSDNLEATRAMLGELENFPALTKMEKFGLVNLPEVEVAAA